MFISYLVPYSYFLKTRLKSNVQKISWLFVYFIPGGFIFNFISPISDLNNFMAMVLAVTLVNYVYENGYIQNDLLTIRKENKPTLRLSRDEIVYMNSHLFYVFFLRTIISLVTLTLFYIVTNDLYKTLILFLVVLIIQLMYLWYNNVRNIINLLLILPLSYLRFYGFILPFIKLDLWFVFILATTILYPLSKALEFTKQSRYHLPRFSKLVGNIDFFRVQYYLITSVLFSAYYFFSGSTLPMVFLIISVYFLIYRLFTLALIKNSAAIGSSIAKNSKPEYRD